MTFSVHLSGAVGELKADVSTPSGGEEDVFMTDLDDEKYALRFIPKENGVFYVSVRLNEAHIPGSPLPILVGKHGADPALVFAKGPGLEKGQVGRSIVGQHLLSGRRRLLHILSFIILNYMA